MYVACVGAYVRVLKGARLLMYEGVRTNVEDTHGRVRVELKCA